MVATTRFVYPPVLVPPFQSLSAPRFAEHFDTQQTLICPSLILRARLRSGANALGIEWTS